MKTLLSIILVFAVSVSYGQINKKDDQDRKQGPWQKSYPGSTTLQWKGQFKDDKPYGKFIFYYEYGGIRVIMNYRKDGKTSDAKMYHETGYMMAKGKYVNKEKDSLWVYYHDKGIVSYQEEYKQGKLHGQQVIYYRPKDDGKYKVAEYYNWKDGKLHGDYKKYHPTTRLAEEGKWENGKRVGKVTKYWENGQKQNVYNYKNGVKHHYQFSYGQDGKRVGYTLWWEGKELTGKEKEAKEAELKANR